MLPGRQTAALSGPPLILLVACAAASCCLPARADRLTSLLEEYFSELSDRPRDAVLKDIEALPDVTPAKVAEAPRLVQLWPRVEPGSH